MRMERAEGIPRPVSWGRWSRSPHPLGEVTLQDLRHLSDLLVLVREVGWETF